MEKNQIKEEARKLVLKYTRYDRTEDEVLIDVVAELLERIEKLEKSLRKEIVVMAVDTVDDNLMHSYPVASLEEAKELAEAFTKDGYHKDIHIKEIEK